MTDHPTLTLDLVRPVAEQIVNEHPMKVAQPGGCFYARDSAPACLVGNILHQLGWTVDELQYMDEPITQAGDTTITTWIHEGYVKADGQTTEYLRSLQHLQDVRLAWGVAYAKTEEAYSR